MDTIRYAQTKPRLSDRVFYLYRRNPKTGEIDEGPLGTGGIVGRPSATKGDNHLYGVTNWHVALDRGASIIRLNTNDGTTRFLEYEPTDWQFIPNRDNLAAVDLMDDLSHETDQVMFTGEQQFISRETLKQLEIGLGEDVFMIGLYVDQDGGKRNIPCGRFGNLAMVANERSPVEQSNGMICPSHLADMRSRTGFSGSPVFVYRIFEADLSQPPLNLKGEFTPFPRGVITTKDHFLGMLGVHCGQFPDAIEVSTSPARTKERIGDPIHDGDELYIPGAMNIVVPAWRISELLDLEVFAMARQKRESALRVVALKRPRAESVAPPAPDENPNHREDFTALLNAAAKKPQSKD